MLFIYCTSFLQVFIFFQSGSLQPTTKRQELQQVVCLGHIELHANRRGKRAYHFHIVFIGSKNKRLEVPQMLPQQLFVIIATTPWMRKRRDRQLLLENRTESEFGIKDGVTMPEQHPAVQSRCLRAQSIPYICVSPRATDVGPFEPAIDRGIKFAALERNILTSSVFKNVQGSFHGKHVS